MVETMSGGNEGPFEAAISMFLIVVLLVIVYAIYTVGQGGDPSGVIRLFSDIAPNLLVISIVAGFVLWILSEVA